jgi:DNA-binding MarR family transcriptional regulator
VDGICASLNSSGNRSTIGDYYAGDTMRPGAGVCRDAFALLERMQGLRRAIFPRSLFSDPAWDLLLTLYKAHISQQRLSILRLAKLAEVAPTTTLRWVNYFVDRKLAARTDDPLDSRRVFVGLTGFGASLMDQYCRELDDQCRQPRVHNLVTSFSLEALVRD